MRTQMTPFQIEAVVVATGVSSTWLAHFIALAVTINPLLQAAGFLISIIVGILTAIYTVKKILKKKE
jgi:ABC-type antimicrobial peptide transport system permease subunit